MGNQLADALLKAKLIKEHQIMPQRQKADITSALSSLAKILDIEKFRKKAMAILQENHELVQTVLNMPHQQLADRPVRKRLIRGLYMIRNNPEQLTTPAKARKFVQKNLNY